MLRNFQKYEVNSESLNGVLTKYWWYLGRKVYVIYALGLCTNSWRRTALPLLSISTFFTQGSAVMMIFERQPVQISVAKPTNETQVPVVFFRLPGQYQYTL
jgi:hypothetical protein